MSVRRIWAQTRKELTQLVRDRLALALALVLPLLQLILIGSALSLTVSGLPIVIQDLDQSAASRALADAFRASVTFHVAPWPTGGGGESGAGSEGGGRDGGGDGGRESGGATEAPLKANAARGVLIIPRHFGRDMARGGVTPVQLLVDGSDANTAGLVAAYSGAIVQAFNAGAAGAPRAPGGSTGGPVRAEIRLWYNPGLSSKRFYGPGIFVLAISMFPLLLATLATAKEGEQKTILQVYVSSISAHEFLLGKICAFVAVSFAEVLLLFCLLFTMFGLSFVGDPTPFLVATVLYAFCVAAFGTMVGAAIPNQAAAMQVVLLGGFLLVFMLSGLLFPIANIPPGLRWLSYFVWGRYYIEIVRDALLAGGGWPAAWPRVLVIAAFGAIFYGMGWRTLRRMQLDV
jgi:ABC-2 type transport system permease protein